MAVRLFFCRDSDTIQSFHMKFLHLLHINDIIIISMNFCVLGRFGGLATEESATMELRSSLLVSYDLGSELVADAAKQLTGFKSSSFYLTLLLMIRV